LDKKILEIYPENLWAGRFTKKSFGAEDLYYPEKEEKPAKKKKRPPWLGKKDKNSGTDAGKFGELAEEWKIALDAWMKFCQELAKSTSLESNEGSRRIAGEEEE
jgi:hypothetical protein